MAWYGKSVNLKVKLPKSLPTYHEDQEIEALLAAAKSKKTHKKMIARDLLLVEVAKRTGLRRAELSNLEVRDVHPDFLIVRQGKGKKDRLIPLSLTTAEKINSFTKLMKPSEKIFKLNPTSLGMKIKDLAKRAGLDNFHCHSLRHKFATDILDSGSDIRVLQHLMGHENLNTTQVYLAITDKKLRDAVNQLEFNGKKPTHSEEKPAKKRLNLDNIFGKRRTELIPNHNTPAWLKKLDEIAKEGKIFTIKREEASKKSHNKCLY